MNEIDWAVDVALPYIGTVVVLVLISRDARRIRLRRPAMLAGRSRRGPNAVPKRLLASVFPVP